MLKVIKAKGRKILIPAVALMSTAFPVAAHAADIPDMSTTITTSVQSIVTNTLTSVAAIAPIGITIFGAMFVWKKGMQFFKQTTK